LVGEVRALSPVIWIPPLILGILSLVLGLFPIISESLVKPAVAAVTGGSYDFHLKIWHGFNTILKLSAITIGSGIALYFLIKPSKKKVEFIAKADFISPYSLTKHFNTGFGNASLKWTRFFTNG